MSHTGVVGRTVAMPHAHAFAVSLEARVGGIINRLNKLLFGEIVMNPPEDAKCCHHVVKCRKTICIRVQAHDGTTVSENIGQRL
jgi:hypothetical protein